MKRAVKPATWAATVDWACACIERAPGYAVLERYEHAVFVETPVAVMLVPLNQSIVDLARQANRVYYAHKGEVS